MNDANLLLVRMSGEIAVKGPRVRKRFERALRDTLVEALGRHGVPHRLTELSGRLFLQTKEVARACDVAVRVFGVSSASPIAVICAGTIEAIVEAGTERFADEVRGKTYAVRTKRQGNHAFGSMDVERALGAALNEGATVKLRDPDVTVSVLILGDKAYLYGSRVQGAGGLPSAVQGKALALMSGGFDSAVAAWRVMKRGVAVDYVFCNLGGGAYERMVLQVTKRLCDLWALGQRPKFHVVDFTAVLEELRASVRKQYWQVVLKQLMYRTGEAIARQCDAYALVTGESIGQVSSQTIANLHAMDGIVDLPIFRPLIAYDKGEIIDEARLIGTAKLSERIKEYCGLGAGRPITAGKRARVREELAAVDMSVLERAVAERKIVDIASTTASDLKMPYLFTEHVPTGAVVIDCNPAHVYRREHAPGAIHHDASDLLDGFRKLDKDRTYVLYCESGTRSSQLSELMQQAGFEAYAFEGGLRALSKQLESA